MARNSNYSDTDAFNAWYLEMSTHKRTTSTTTEQYPSDRVRQITSSVDEKQQKLPDPNAAVQYSDDKYQVYGEQRDAARRQYDDDRFNSRYDQKYRAYDDVPYDSNSQGYYSQSTYNDKYNYPRNPYYPDSQYPASQYPDSQYSVYSRYVDPRDVGPSRAHFRPELPAEIQYNTKDPKDVRRMQTIHRYKTSRKDSSSSSKRSQPPNSNEHR